jgi:PDZ domain-containing protein
VRRAAFLLGVGAIVAALFVVPIGFIAIEPGPALPVAPRVHLAAPAHPVNGRLLLTTVRLSDASTVGALAGWLDDETDIVSRQAVVPPGVDEKEYLAAQQRLFRESAQVAAAVGLRLAGYEATVSGGGAQVAGVISGSPAAGKLREGDVITAVDGRPVTLASDVTEATARARAGDEVVLNVRRGDERRTVRIRLDRVRELGRPGLGVALRTLDLTVRLPVPVQVEQGSVAGPSAGLMLALTIYDLAGPADIVRGRTIAGTGTIDLAGHVGLVGGVRQKVDVARSSGATVFLVPAAEAKEARAAAGKDLTVLPVQTINDAVAALVNGSQGPGGDLGRRSEGRRLARTTLPEH